MKMKISKCFSCFIVKKPKLKKNMLAGDYLGVHSAADGCIKLAVFATPRTDQLSPRSNHCFPEPEGERYRGN